MKKCCSWCQWNIVNLGNIPGKTVLFSFPGNIFCRMHGTQNTQRMSSPNVFGEDLLLLVVNECNRYTQQNEITLNLSLKELKTFSEIVSIMGVKILPS